MNDCVTCREDFDRAMDERFESIRAEAIADHENEAREAEHAEEIAEGDEANAASDGHDEPDDFEMDEGDDDGAGGE